MHSCFLEFQSGKKEVIVMRLKQGLRFPGIEHIKSKILVYPFDSKSHIYDSFCLGGGRYLNDEKSGFTSI